jgi:hypothetical protein
LVRTAISAIIGRLPGVPKARSCLNRILMLDSRERLVEGEHTYRDQ